MAPFALPNHMDLRVPARNHRSNRTLGSGRARPPELSGWSCSAPGVVARFHVRKTAPPPATNSKASLVSVAVHLLRHLLIERSGSGRRVRRFIAHMLQGFAEAHGVGLRDDKCAIPERYRAKIGLRQLQHLGKWRQAAGNDVALAHHWA